MQIDWTHFTPWASLAGGVLIGLASALYLLGSGRIAGISGLLAGPLNAVLRASSLRPQADRLSFLAGLLAAPWLWRLFAPLPPVVVDIATPGLVLAGLLVGVGTRMGEGCTSGHGVCGLSRLSPRSLANVLAFMGAGVVAVFLLRHVWGGAA